MPTPDPAPAPPSDPARSTPLHRSGAVARMLGMPVATLRVWERRYALTNTAVSPGGQRLYSAADVRRLAVLKQLSDAGHAIGSVAHLNEAQLTEVSATHHQAQAGGLLVRRPAAARWRVVVVGPVLATRLQRAMLLREIGRPVEWLGPFASVAQAAAALEQGPPADAWLLHEPQLHAGWLAALEAAMPGLAPAAVAVLYGFAAERVCQALALRGVTLLREPQPDAVLGPWLRHWARDWHGEPQSTASEAKQTPPEDWPAHPVTPAPRRWDEAALAEVAALSTSVACECPRHVAELLIQVQRFESYCQQCEQRSPADAQLHGWLAGVAAQARVAFEAALQRVAQHEALVLPPPAAAGSPEATSALLRG